MIKEKVRKVIVGTTLALTLVAGTVPAYARNVGYFSNFTVTYSGGEKFTDYVTKSNSGGKGVVNMNDDSGAAWITANMKNSDGQYRGGCTLQRGTRKTFTNSGKAYYKYKLGLSKTNNTGGGKVTIKGSWSPDEK